MRIFAVCAVMAVTAGTAQADVKVPYLKTISDRNACGSFSRNCVPTSSGDSGVIRGGLDFDRPEQFLGRKYSRRNSIFNNEPCTPRPTSADWRESGRQSVAAELERDSANELTTKFNADVDEYLRNLGAGLPANLAADLKSKATDKLNANRDVFSRYTYARYDLTQDFIDANVRNCQLTLGRNEFGITGVSVVSISGDWTRERIVSGIGDFELTAAFIGLSPEAKANWNERKRIAFAGKFEPLATVIGYAYRKQVRR